MTNKATKIPRAPFFVRFANRILKGLLRLGLPMGPMILLTVRGRKTGQLRTTPVGLFEVDGRRYLFSTFGKVNWVYNLRAAREAILTHGLRKETYAAVELPPDVAAHVLRDAFAPYLASIFMRPMLRSWYDVTPDTSLNDFVTVAQSHPVFELRDSLSA